jgi:hypothetical protein
MPVASFALVPCLNAAGMLPPGPLFARTSPAHPLLPTLYCPPSIARPLLAAPCLRGSTGGQTAKPDVL